MTADETPVRRVVTEAGKYLAFWLGNEEFAVPVGRVREIIPWQEITPVPKVPEHVLGVINLRGKVVPVMDLRQRLGMPAAERNARSCIVVLQGDGKALRSPVGAAVDGVSEVLQIAAGDVEETASLAGEWIESGFVRQIAKCRGKVKLLLAIESVLASPGAGVGAER
jgi:purine-binding chemotaxis protein CheW